MIYSSKLTPKALTELIELVKSGTIGGKTAKDILPKIFETGRSPKDLVAESGSTQISDEGALNEIVDKVISENAPSVESFKAGKENAVKFLIGQAMKLSKGRANPKVLEELLIRKLKS